MLWETTAVPYTARENKNIYGDTPAFASGHCGMEAEWLEISVVPGM
jgi:hypothetical protein